MYEKKNKLFQGTEQFQLEENAFKQFFDIQAKEFSTAVISL